MQNLSQTAKDALHHWRYEKTEILPEGDLTKPVPAADGTEAILSVTSDKTDTLYLRGFVGDTYENGAWSALDAETAANEKDLFYWLHENGFYPQSQFALSAAEYETATIQFQIFPPARFIDMNRSPSCPPAPERPRTALRPPLWKPPAGTANANIPTQLLQTQHHSPGNSGRFAAK